MALITRSSKNNITYDNIFVILGEGELNKTLLRKTLNQYKLRECPANMCYNRRPKIIWFSYDQVSIYKLLYKYYQTPVFISNTLDKIKTITVKDTLFYNMKKYFPNDFNKYMQNSFDLTPDYILPDNIVVIARPTVFIGNNKPNITACSGEGVMVIHDNNSLEKAKEQLKNYQNILLSDYITNPLLFQNKKFHLRMYFFATINNNIFRTYLLNFGYIYTALLPYKNAEYNNKNIHDTHWGTTSKDFIYPNSLMHLGGDNVNNITSQMRTILYRTSMILYNEKVSNYENSANSYYIFGVDFMIKDKLDNFDVVLIEINHSPGFKHKNPNDNTLEHRIFTFVNKISFNPLLTKSDPIIDKNDISTIPLLVKTLN